jgi:hypothetical protein
MENAIAIKGCRSLTTPDRSCPVRVVSTEPWLVCEARGVRLVFPPVATAPERAHDGWLLVSDWVIDELVRAGGKPNEPATGRPTRSIGDAPAGQRPPRKQR